MTGGQGGRERGEGRGGRSIYLGTGYVWRNGGNGGVDFYLGQMKDPERAFKRSVWLGAAREAETRARGPGTNPGMLLSGESEREQSASHLLPLSPELRILLR